MITRNLATRMTLIMSGLMALVLGGVISFIGYSLRTDLVEVITEDYGHIVDARAGEVAAILKGHWDQLTMLAQLDGMAHGSLSDARAISGSITTSKAVSDIISLAVIDSEGTINLVGGGSIDISKRDYYEAVFKQGATTHVSDVLIPQSYDKPAVMLTRAVPRPDGTKFAVVMQISLESLSRVISGMDIGNGGSGWIVDQRTTFIAHPDPARIMATTLSAIEGESDNAVSLRALAGELSTGDRGASRYIDERGREISTFYATIPETPNWKIGIDVPDDAIFSSVASLMTVLALSFAVALAVTVMVSIAVARSISRPVKLVASEFRELASGDADLTKSLPVLSNDEIGGLATDFNLFLSKLREMVRDIKETQSRLGLIGDELHSDVMGSGEAVSRIVARIGGMKTLARTQGDCVSESSSSVEEIAKTIESLDMLIANQAAAITQASSSIEEMVGNIASVSASVERIASGFVAINESSERGLTMQTASAERVHEISALSATLLEANDVISNIASQTNLLAMNAAIEAAHAGEAGKGFSVVSDEIRRLAETSTEQSKSIGKGLKTVQAAIESVVDTSSRTGLAFSDLAAMINTTGDLVREVGAAMGEQKEGSAQILDALKSMNDISSQVRSGSSEMREGNDAILGAIARLKASAQEIDGSVDDIARGIENVNERTGSISDVTGRTGGLIERLEDAVGRFRT